MESRIIRVFILLFLLVLIDRHPVTEGKPRNKQSKIIANCSVEFLWEALSAASRGNQSAGEFLRTNLSDIGFTANGIIPKSVAARWQAKLGGLASKTIFSQLQKLSMIELINWPNCENCRDSPNSVIMAYNPMIRRKKKSPDPQKRRQRHKNSKNIKYVIKTVNKLFDPIITEENLIDTELRNRKLKRVLITFLDNQVECVEKDSKTNKTINSIPVPAKKKKKTKNLPQDIIQVCLMMIEALLQFDMCDVPPEKFLWTLNETRYHYDIGGEIPYAVTVPFP